MMQSRIVIILVSLLLGYEPMISQDFYPLHVGNLWQYKVYFQGEFRGYSTLTITKDSIMTNGKRYFLSSNGDIERMGDSLISYRYDSKNFDADTSTNELILNRFGAPVGSSWQSFQQPVGPRGVVAKMETSYLTTWFGEVVETNEVSYHTQSGLFGGRNYYSKKHGLIYYAVEGGASYELTGAKIGGVTYGTITNVNKPGNELPQYFVVYEPYPNPFNPSTTIKYTIPRRALIRLVIHDVLGKEVRTLVEDVQEAGSYNVLFDAAALPSGIYFYRLTAGRNTGVGKMILLR